MKDEKTNVMRILEQKKIPYRSYNYSQSGAISGVDVADYLKLSYDKVFKTLVTVGKSGRNYVFVIPVDKELDLKKAALASGEKNVSMVKSKELLPFTGYIHGGCSPIGMKKFFKTFFHSAINMLDEVSFSGGKIGAFVTIASSDIKKAIEYSIYDLTV